MMNRRLRLRIANARRKFSRSEQIQIATLAKVHNVEQMLTAVIGQAIIDAAANEGIDLTAFGTAH
jgi:hypothetical protein